MGTIRQDRKDLEALLNGVSSSVSNIGGGPSSISQGRVSPAPTPTNVVDNTSGTTLEPERVFEFDYDAIKKTLKKRARRTVANVTRHILTDDLLESDYVKDKIEQDVDTLADLYMQVETNNIMQRSILETVSRGNTMPRMFEVFGQLTDKIQAINKQIISTESQIRKTYIDLKYEIKDRAAEEIESQRENAKVLGDSSQIKDANIVTSSKQLIEMAKKKHMEKLKAAREIESEECK